MNFIQFTACQKKIIDIIKHEAPITGEHIAGKLDSYGQFELLQQCDANGNTVLHRIAREKYSIYGISLTGRIGLSPRAYRG